MKTKKCTSTSKRHKWEFKGNVTLKTVQKAARHISVTLATRGKYLCATCGAKKFAGPRFTPNDHAAG